MKKPFPKIVLRILLVCVLLLGFLYMDNDIGTSAANLESDIRNLQKIPGDWIVEGNVSDTMAAYISSPRSERPYFFCLRKSSRIFLWIFLSRRWESFLG